MSEGVLKLYHDYRSGAVLDRSGNSNHATIIGPKWTNDGLRYNLSTSYLAVSDSTELRLTEGTLIVFGDIRNGNGDRLIHKRDSGGTNYDFYMLSSDRLAFYDGSSEVTLTIDFEHVKYAAVNFKTGETPEGFVDGISAGNFSGSVTVTTDDADVRIGNYYSSIYGLESSLLRAALIVSRKLTETEHTLLNAELSRLEWPKAVQSISYGNIGIDVSDSDLIAAYNMHPSENEVADISSNGWEGVVHGAAQENTILGSAMRFDGSEHYIDLQTLASTSGTYTFSMWIKSGAAAGTTDYTFDTQSGRLILGFFTNVSGEIGFYDGTWSSFGTAPNDDLWHHVVYVFDGSGGTCKLYVDAVQLGTSKSYTSKNIGTKATLCSDYNGNDSFECSLINFAIYDSVKSTDWIAQEYEKGRSAGWKTEYGAFVSGTNITSGYLENTPFEVKSGTWKIVSDIIEGKEVKAIECIVAGTIYIPIHWFQQTPTEAAYGAWDWWIYHANASRTKSALVANSKTHTLSNGYNLDILNTEGVILQKTNIGNIFSTVPSYVSSDTWLNFRVTRSRVGALTAYLNGTLIDVSGGTGTNPVTDTSYTVSNYTLFDFGVGDRLSLGNIPGNYAMVKGVLS
jgi:hypothetical protein